jgi:hypothetical protein
LRIKPFLPSLEVPLVQKVSIRTFVGEDVGGEIHVMEGGVVGEL